MPCGFCGRSGIAACAELYLTTGKAPQVVSSCAFAHKFYYKSAKKHTSSSACTNVPIRCLLPGCSAFVGKNVTAVWKYNIGEHIQLCHPGHATSDQPQLDSNPLPPAMLEEMFLSRQEELDLGIPAEKIPPKSTDYPSATSATISQQGSRLMGSKRLLVEQTQGKAVKKARTRS